MNKIPLSGYVFAGGKSLRMGTDKALLTIDNQPILLRMINLINPFCDFVAISGQNENYSVFKLEMVPDVYSDCGPISGIYSCLQHSKTDWNLILSVDVPFVTDEFVKCLISNIDECDCVVPKHTFGIEPLVALYHKKALPVVGDKIRKGDYKLMNLLDALDTKLLDSTDFLIENPGLFHNLNNPEDYRTIG